MPSHASWESMAERPARTYGGVTVEWDPGEGLLRMRHGRDPELSEHVATTLGTQVQAWIQGREGTVGAIVDARGLGYVPDDWRDYWIKVLRRGFVKGVAIHGADPSFEAMAEGMERVTRIPVRLLPDEAACRDFLAGLGPVSHRPATPATG